MNNLLHSSLDHSTLIQYQKVWSNFMSFASRGLSHYISLPADSHTVGLYISHLDQLGLKPSTIQSHLSAISFAHKIRTIVDPTQSFLITKLMVALNKNNVTDKRLPVTHLILIHLIHATRLVLSNDYEIAMYSAMFSVAYYACLRVGEYCVSNNDKHVLQYDQISMGQKPNNVRSIIVDFRSFKHSNHEGAMLEISSQRDTSCPVSLLSKYMYIRPKINGPIFVNQSGKAITRLQFQAVFHRCISFLSLDTARYNTHSLRIGRCTDMMTQGYSDSQIKAVGRWKSDAFKRYIRPTIVSL